MSTALNYMLKDDASEVLERKIIHSLYLTQEPEQGYFFYLPENLTPQTEIFVCVHGISRNAEEHVRLFKTMADLYQVAIVSPYFSRKHFPDYQRLGCSGRGKRADLTLLKIFNEVKERTQITHNRFYLFGFSGGAQFAHRFSMAYPKKVAKLAIAASGWYTWPTMRNRFPYGLGNTEQLADLRFDLDRFLSIPVSIFVGEDDIQQDNTLNRSKKVTLQQGDNRLERARSWLKALQREADRRRRDTEYQFQVLKGVGHSFSECVDLEKMDQLVFESLFGQRLA